MYLDSDLLGAVLLDVAFFKSSSTLFRNVQAVLSFNFEKRVLNFFTVAAGPLTEAYFPRMYRSSSLHFVYFDRLDDDALAMQINITQTSVLSGKTCN